MKCNGYSITLQYSQIQPLLNDVNIDLDQSYGPGVNWYTQVISLIYTRRWILY